MFVACGVVQRQGDRRRPLALRQAAATANGLVLSFWRPRGSAVTEEVSGFGSQRGWLQSAGRRVFGVNTAMDELFDEIVDGGESSEAEEEEASLEKTSSNAAGARLRSGAWVRIGYGPWLLRKPGARRCLMSGGTGGQRPLKQQCRCR